MPDSEGVSAAVAELRAGRLVIVVDDADRENEADLVVAATDVRPEQIAFMSRHTTGILCVPMPGERLDLLEIGLMVGDNSDPHRTAFTVSVDHVGVSTGVSAADRCATANALADPEATAEHFTRPGHMFPLRAREGGVLKRAGHTEAAVDLLTLADRAPVAVISELINDDGTMLRGGQIDAFAAAHGLAVVTVAELVRYRRRHDRLVTRSGSATLPTAHGEFQAVAYQGRLDGAEHLALVLGDPTDSPPDGLLVRVHSECLTGDLFGSRRCDCGDQLAGSLDAISQEGRGVLIYLRGQEGRGIGLGHKLRAYALQDRGHDTVDANLALGLPVDSREYGIGAQMLSDLGVSRMRLITNNPAKYGGLEGYDIEITERHSLPTTVTAHNVEYLRAKRDRLGHHITVPLPGDAVSA
ncbi:bifunctional 3,4-dihydroxy-2-butanone-4-phosphate synthase/GTP cyclohydrolase II [Prauserella sp. ASG 168]|uniref:Riboflavin biosynthesis protein RibBA n=2 Tax=Prauserella cavernicola TaxID=2800127 RepID=A0A934QWV2_9PSEU|nr:bifunctional 3,4-dihydroxy-2-butanone-4-phosphate synthase/GTP cyclohydrolase II [Prauserella cavernicola]